MHLHDEPRRSLNIGSYSLCLPHYITEKSYAPVIEAELAATAAQEA
ncbi:MAG: hypothetical protein Q4B91_06255 [Atopobiaceae bacterium]|nr:hypothetical protein [Atopobiaceae bacterium]